MNVKGKRQKTAALHNLAEFRFVLMTVVTAFVESSQTSIPQALIWL